MNRSRPPRRRPSRAPLLVLAALLAGGCAALPRTALWHAARADGPGDARLAAGAVGEAVRDLPKSRSGNRPEYTVGGRRYRTLESAAGFRERGLASWYGAKFHGRPTASGEPFDMHALSAAHRALPLPTFVRVTDVASGRSVIVKVNDRGPFVDDRVIDLSYAAAHALGVVEQGTTEVLVEALSRHPESDGAPATGTEGAAPGPGGAGAARLVQLGAFRERANAVALARRAADRLGRAPRVEHDAARALYRVRLGPFVDAAALEHTLATLARTGFDGYTLEAASRP